MERETREEQAKRIGELENKLRTLTSESDFLRAELESCRQSIHDFRELDRARALELNNAANEKVNLIQELNKVKAALSEQAEREAHARSVIEQLNEALSAQHKRSLSLGEKIELYARCINQLEASSALKQNCINSIQSENTMLNALLARNGAGEKCGAVVPAHTLRDPHSKEELQKLEFRAQKLEVEKRELMGKLLRIDKERDELVEALDSKVEENSEMSAKLAGMEAQLTELRESLAAHDRAKLQLSSQLADSCGVMESLAAENTRLWDEVRNLKARAQRAENEK